MSLRILVTGSRDWIDPLPVRTLLAEQLLAVSPIEGDPVLISGNCRGADRIAENEWSWLSRTWRGTLRVQRFPARWNEHGKAAGPIRNQGMVDSGAHVCCAFPFPDSRGTYDCMRRAHAAGIPVVTPDGPWSP